MADYFELIGQRVALGKSKALRLPISETFTGTQLEMPIQIMRGKKPGPTLLVTAAVHGDEINGTGIVHELLWSRRPDLVSGTVVLLPVVDLFGFETQTRYMPDRRDLNRCFPGSPEGSLSSRFAATLFREVLTKADYCLDLHSAGTGRTNFPNVRADLNNRGCRMLAKAFGCELIVNGTGPEGSMRRAAVKAGVPTVILEAGEPSKIEPGVLEIGVRGVMNVLSELGMIRAEPTLPPYQTQVKRTTWLRASAGGLLRFHVAPGDLLEKDQPVTTNYSVLGEEQNVQTAPADCIVLGMTTLPVVKPGEPIAHLAMPTKSHRSIKKALAAASQKSVDHEIRRNLASNMVVSEHGES